MLVATASSRRATSTVEEDDLYAVLSRYSSEVFFSLIDSPVCSQITAVFGAVRETAHNLLSVLSELEVAEVLFV